MSESKDNDDDSNRIEFLVTRCVSLSATAPGDEANTRRKLSTAISSSKAVTRFFDDLRYEDARGVERR